MIWEVELRLKKSKENPTGASMVIRVQAASEKGAKELALSIWDWPNHGIEFKPKAVIAKPVRLLQGEIQ